MPEDEQRVRYRTLIDMMVEECREGGGQVFSGRVRRGVWSPHALEHPDDLPEEHLINTVLAQLGREDRVVVARMLELSYEGGIHDVLRVLHDEEVAPFDDAYEGTPAHDFMGRLVTDWEWPD